VSRKRGTDTVEFLFLVKKNIEDEFAEQTKTRQK